MGKKTAPVNLTVRRTSDSTSISARSLDSADGGGCPPDAGTKDPDDRSWSPATGPSYTRPRR